MQQNPALVDVQLCTVTGCSPTGPQTSCTSIRPATRGSTSVSPASGPAAGGTKVTIGGQNLGCALDVFFGKVDSQVVHPAIALLDCGSTITLTATSPKGKAGAKVPVTVDTIESYFANAGHGTSSAKFTYK